MSRIEQDNDNVVYVNGSEETQEHNKRVQREISRRKKIVFFAVLIVAAVAGIVIYIMLHKEYKGYKVVKSAETNYENTASYVQFAGNLLK